ncbi:hypothetical protein [Erythrobacter sp. BLCC-B19]|uniref:hypothetical protein n=1 Tax=Erythrobacter sp. BLCC-B19 TaxID=3025315 RepID=UPI002361487D|nr:hypothetical protein [Erythrobacter sp. BLCC-B19]WDA42612.1 hypothetical protein PS060_07330 [Erythrobacter sp. BLCC-B19]
MARQRQRGAALRRGAAAMLALALSAPVAAQSGASCAADPEAAARSYNYILGTQAIGGPYQHTKGNRLIEQANNVRGMGSNLLKISLAEGAAPAYDSAEAARGAKTTLDYVKAAPAVQQALDMDFTYYQAWVHSFTDATWRDGVDMTEARQYYDEMYALTAWLLERYSGTGKVFMLGNWEGDWLLLGRQNRELDPSPTAVEGMIAWMKIRQLAVDNARAAVAHKDVAVYHYIEVNLVKKAMAGRPSIGLSVLREVNPDLVSYSAYEAIKQSPTPDLMSIRQPLEEILGFLEAQLPPKEGLPFKRRVFIGEFGYHADRAKPLTVKQQYMKSRFVMQSAVALDLPFALIWQMYNNEYTEDGRSKEMSLIDERGRKRALYMLHRNYLAEMKSFVAQSCRDTGALPSRDAFRARALEVLKASGFEKMQALEEGWTG